MWRDDNHIEVAPKGIDTESMTTNMYLGMHVIWANNGEIPSPFCQTRAPGQCFTGRVGLGPDQYFFCPEFVRPGWLHQRRHIAARDCKHIICEYGTP